MFEDRRAQLDLRLSKAFQLGATRRLTATLDLYNVLNANSVLWVNDVFGDQWRLPVGTNPTGPGILDARLLQVGAQFNW